MIKILFRTSFVSILACAAMYCASALAADPLAVRYYEDATSRFSSGDLKGAEIQLKNSLTRDPTQLSARLLMGRIQLELGNIEQAEEELLMANNLGADPALTALPLATVRNRLGKQQLNIDTLVPTSYSIDLQPDLWAALGIARLQNNDAAGARIAFEQAIRIKPLHEDGTLGLVRISLQQHEFGEAETLATAAVEKFPGSAQAWLLKASALHAQAKNREAATAYGRARDLDPGSGLAGLGEATALLDANQTAKAAALLQSLRNEFPWMPQVPYLQSKALKQLGRKAESEMAQKAASELVEHIAPADMANNPELLKLTGTIAYENGQFERAYRAISLYQQSRPDDIDGRKLLARIALAMRKPGDAKRVLVPVVTAGKADAETLGLLGDANAQTNDYITAESYYRDAITNFQGGPALIGRLGAIQYRQGQRDEALDTLQTLTGQYAPEALGGISLYTAMLLFAEGQLEETQEIVDVLVAEQPENLLALNLQATLAIARGKYVDAQRMLKSIVQKDPDFRPARYNLAKLHIIEKQYREADRILSRFLADDPNDVSALQESARLAVAMNDPRAAIQHYEKIRELNNKALIPTIELVDLYLAESRPSDAMNVALGLTRALPSNFYAHETFARVLLARNKLDEARTVLKKTAQLAGYDSRKLMRVVRLQKIAGAYDDVIVTVSKVSANHPEASAARHELATALFRLGRMQEAKQEVDQILLQQPDDPYALSLLGDIQLAQGQHQKAVETYGRALESADLPELVVGRYIARTMAGEAKAALTELEAWHEAHPNEPLVLRALAERRHQLGETATAQKLYERLIVLTPDDALLHNNLANLLMEVDIERALKAVQRAHQLAPSNPAILDTLGWALIQLGDLDQGLSHLRNAVARNGRSATARYHLGVALEEFGSLTESKRQLTQALRLAGNAPWSDDARLRLQRLP